MSTKPVFDLDVLLGKLQAGDIKAYNLTAEELAVIVHPDHEKENSVCPTFLHLAVKYGCVNQISGGVTYKQLVSVKDKQGDTPLHWAGYSDIWFDLKDIVSLEQWKLVKNNKGQTPWQLIDDDCREEIEEYHENKGKDKPKYSPNEIEDAIDNLELADYDITAEELSKMPYSFDGLTSTMLHHAAWQVDALEDIKGGVTVEQLLSVKDSNGNTPLHILAIEGYLSSLSDLTKAQLQSVKNDEGKTPWDLADDADRRWVEAKEFNKTTNKVVAKTTPKTEAKPSQSFAERVEDAIFNCDVAVLNNVTVEQLAALPYDLASGNKQTLLHYAAINFPMLKHLKGGVTAEQLLSVADANSNTPLHLLVDNGGLFSLTTPATVKQLQSVMNDDNQTPWDWMSEVEQAEVMASEENKVKPVELTPKPATNQEISELLAEVIDMLGLLQSKIGDLQHQSAQQPQIAEISRFHPFYRDDQNN